MSSRSKRSSRSSSTSHSESHSTTPKQKSVSFSEKHFVIRFPPDLASNVMTKILKEDNAAKEEDALRKQAKKEAQKGGAGNGKENNIVRRALTPILNMHFISGVEGDGGREGYFQFEGTDYPFILYDLPCIVEAYKTLDMMNYYKVDDIHQFFVVKPAGSTFETLSSESLSQLSTATPNTSSSQQQQQHKHSYTAKDISEERLYYTQDDLDHFAEKEKFETFEKKLRKYLFDSGLTPPTKNIVKHWQKQEVNITMKDIEDMIQEFSNLIEEEDPNNKVDIEFVTDDESRAHEIEIEQQRQQQQLQQLDEKMNEELESNAASPTPSTVSNAPPVPYSSQSSFSAPSSQPLSNASAPIISSQQEDRMEVDSIAKEDEWNDLDEELQSALDEKQTTQPTAPSIIVHHPQPTVVEKQNDTIEQPIVNNSNVQTSKSPVEHTSPMDQATSPSDSSSSVTVTSVTENSPPSTTDASPVSAMSTTEELRITMDSKMRLESELRNIVTQITSYQQQYAKATNPKMKKTFQTYLERLDAAMKEKHNQIRILDEKVKTLQTAMNK